jgi:hypothetical protein
VDALAVADKDAFWIEVDTNTWASRFLRRAPSGGHIRLVTGVRQTTRKGKAIIEFDTAESSGDSTSRERGQISKTNKTGGLDDWGRIKGSFHRL